MSVHFEYKTLFSVTSEDSVNAAFKLEIFSFYPTIECEELLNNYRLIFSSSPQGFTVYYKLDRTRPANDQLAAEIKSEKRFLFNFILRNPSLKKEYPSSFKMTNGPQFYLNNLDGANVKSDGASLHIDNNLGDDDNLQLDPVDEMGKFGHYSGKRTDDDSPFIFDLRTRIQAKKPLGVMEIVVKKSQNIFNDKNYKIKLIA